MFRPAVGGRRGGLNRPIMLTGRHVTSAVSGASHKGHPRQSFAGHSPTTLRWKASEARGQNKWSISLESWRLGDSRYVFFTFTGAFFGNFGCIEFGTFPLCLRYRQSMEWPGSIRWIYNPVQSRRIWIELDQKFSNSADSGLDWIEKYIMCISYLEIWSSFSLSYLWRLKL